ncbi:MAG TPA: DinB family protein [Bacillales bacterium]|nr:DinB family protein [Bacillales bacterium]
METTDLLVLNFEEIRRRSIKIWKEIPHDLLDWKPDAEAMSFREMIHHVLASEHGYGEVLKNRGTVHEGEDPYEGRIFLSVASALEFAKPYREKFMKLVKSYKEEELTDIMIDRTEDAGYIRPLGDMLLRIGYHEAVHAGQMLDYMRTVQIRRPDIWD